MHKEKTPSRREFLATSSLVLLSATVAPAQIPPASQQPPTPAGQPTPGAPPAFGTAPAVGPEVSPATFADAEKLVQIEMTAADRAEAAGNWRVSMAGLLERRTGPRKIALPTRTCPRRCGTRSCPA